MASHVLVNVAANSFFDTADQSYSFKSAFTGATADTQTTLAFVQQDDQTVTFPDLSGTVPKADTLVVTGSSGLSQSLQFLTISSSAISSLTTPLKVADGGTGLTTAGVSTVIAGNGGVGTALIPITLSTNQLLVGTAGAPAGATITTLGTKVTFPSSTVINIASFMVPVSSKTSVATFFATTASSTNLLTSGVGSTPASTIAGSVTVPANTLTFGDVIYINANGRVTIATNTVTMSLVLTLGGGATLHTSSIVLPIGTYFLNIKAWIVCGSGVATNANVYGQVQAIAWTGAGSFVTQAYAAPVVRNKNYTGTLVVSLAYTTSGFGTMNYVPGVCTSYIVKGS